MHKNDKMKHYSDDTKAKRKDLHIKQGNGDRIHGTQGSIDHRRQNERDAGEPQKKH